jgi:signal transduction histidine kinase
MLADRKTSMEQYLHRMRANIADSTQNVFRQLPERKLLIRAKAPDYLIEDMTDSYATMFGLKRTTVVGRPYFTVFPGSTDEAMPGTSNLADAFRIVVQTRKPQIQQLFRHDLPNPDKAGAFTEQYWRTTLYPIFDARWHRRVTHILQVSSNATLEVLASRELEEARLHLEEALEAGKVGSWSWDVDADTIVGNAELANIFGTTKEEARKGLPFAHFISKIHPKDRGRVITAMEQSIDTKISFDIEFRVLNGEETKWVLGRGRLLEGQAERRLSGVTVDVTERRDLQAQIELARRQDRLNRQEAKMLQLRNEELQALSRTKDEFVALASHQLRTPATAVKQYLGMVLQGYAGGINDLQRDMLDKAFESNERQLQIINQILNAARADTGRLIMTPAPFDVATMVRGVAEEQRSPLKDHNHKLIVRLPAKGHTISGDSGYLRMAVENLISNADKYTPEGGTITVSLKERRSGVRIAVRDTGVGIAKKDIDKLFTKFSRIHNPLSIKAGGSGIGLYLASEIVKLHGGALTVSSKPNKGTTFTIELHD